MSNNRSDMSGIRAWNDQDLAEAHLLITTIGDHAPADQAVLDELHRRAMGGIRSNAKVRPQPRLWDFAEYGEET